MLISPKRSDFIQHRLFDEPLGNHGHRRVVIGDLAEQLTMLFFGGFESIARHITRCNCDYCPDVTFLLERTIYLECKAVGNTRRAIIYKGRLERDCRFAATHQLFYAIWHHRASTLTVDMIQDLRQLVIKNLDSFYLVPFSEIYSLCLESSLMKFNSGYGYKPGSPINKKVYGEGYRLPLNKLQSWKVFDFEYSPEID